MHIFYERALQNNYMIQRIFINIPQCSIILVFKQSNSTNNDNSFEFYNHSYH